MRKLLVSTGTMVGRINGFDYRTALDELSRLYGNGLCDGLELMMLNFYYDKQESVVSAVKGSKVPPLVIHCEKDVGTFLSDAGAYLAEGKNGDALEAREKAFEFFEKNCVFAEELGIDRMVLHLWGGLNSDRHIEYNISALEELSKIAHGHGVRLLIENIPSQQYDPRTNWHSLLPHLGDNGLIFDTRFGCLHAQSKEILTDKSLTDRIEHIHISDFGGGYREFSALRPILHPGEGHVDFEEIAYLLDSFGYDGTVTLESPVIRENGIDREKQRRTLEYLHELFHI